MPRNVVIAAGEHVRPVVPFQRAEMNVSVTGLPKGRAAADNLSILAHRLHNGDWSLMVFDDVNLEMLKDGSSERVLRAFTDLPHETDGVSGGSSSTGGGDRP